MMKNNSVIIKALVLVVTVIALGATATYAYFQIAVSGSETTSTINVSGATLKLVYAAGSKTINASNIIPGWTDKKLFNVTITNGAAKEVVYNINLVIQKSNFFTTAADTDNPDNKSGTSYLQYSLNSCLDSSDTTCNTPVPDATAKILAKDTGTQLVKQVATTAASGTTYYALVLSFPNNTKLAQSQTGTDRAPLVFKGYVTVTSSTQINAGSR